MHRWMICVGMMSIGLSASGAAIVSSSLSKKVATHPDQTNRDLDKQVTQEIQSIHNALPRSQRSTLRGALELVPIGKYDSKMDKVIITQGPGYEHRIVRRHATGGEDLFFETRLSFNDREFHLQAMGPEGDDYSFQSIAIERQGSKADKARITNSESLSYPSRRLSAEADELMRIHWGAAETQKKLRKGSTFAF